MQLSIHLSFGGQCEAAFRFYERVLGGTVSLMLTYKDSPMAAQVPADWQDKIVHATLQVGNLSLAGGDLTNHKQPQGFAVLLELTELAEAERVFAALSAGGEVHMPLQETFWASRFGVLVDQFGTPWEINFGSPQLQNAGTRV